MKAEIFAYALPLCLFLIVAEVVMSWYFNRRYYRLNESISGLSTGIIFLLAGVPALAGSMIVYYYIETNWSLMGVLGWNFPTESPVAFTSAAPFVEIRPLALGAWLLVIIAADFIYYWFHRFSHEVNFLWGTHVTHHSSEEFNLAISFRGGAFQRFFEYTFYFSLAFVGVPWYVFLLSHRILKLYQFWVHSPAVGKLGIFEKFMVTPSNHRVHHGVEAKYIDKNHGGILILWDKWFGTFEPEAETPTYGITTQSNSFSPIWNNIHVYAEIISNVRKARSFSDAMRFIFGRPGWRPEYMEKPEPADLGRPKYNPVVPAGLTAYSLFQFVFLAGGGMVSWVVLHNSLVPFAQVLLLLAFVILGLTVICAILENKAWSFSTEVWRNIGLGTVALALYLTENMSATVAVTLTSLAVVSLLWLFLMRNDFAGTRSGRGSGNYSVPRGAMPAAVSLGVVK